MTKSRYYDYLERYNYLVNSCGHILERDTEFIDIKNSLLKQIKLQLRRTEYDLNTFNKIKLLLHQRRYLKLTRKMHDMKELYEKISDNKPIELMYFIGSYRGPLHGVLDDLLSGMKSVWYPIIVLVVAYMVLLGIFYIM